MEALLPSIGGTLQVTEFTAVTSSESPRGGGTPGSASSALLLSFQRVQCSRLSPASLPCPSPSRSSGFVNDLGVGSVSHI